MTRPQPTPSTLLADLRAMTDADAAVTLYRQLIDHLERVAA